MNETKRGVLELIGKDRDAKQKRVSEILKELKSNSGLGKIEGVIKLQAQIIDQYRNAEIFSDEQMKIINEVIETAKEEIYKKGYEDGLKAKRIE